MNWGKAPLPPPHNLLYNHMVIYDMKYHNVPGVDRNLGFVGDVAIIGYIWRIDPKVRT